MKPPKDITFACGYGFKHRKREFPYITQFVLTQPEDYIGGIAIADPTVGSLLHGTHPDSPPSRAQQHKDLKRAIAYLTKLDQYFEYVIKNERKAHARTVRKKTR